jgi:spore maturation protein CgeB
MVQAGYSPSVRLFEAAACGATIVSDNWPGLEEFFRAGVEILLPASSDDVARYIQHTDDRELKQIGEAAMNRVLAEHTSEKRAEQFETAVEHAAAKYKQNRAAVLAS